MILNPQMVKRKAFYTKRLWACNKCIYLNDLKAAHDFWFDADNLGNIPLFSRQTVYRTDSFNLFFHFKGILLLRLVQMWNWSIWKRKLEFLTQIESVTVCLLIMHLFVFPFKKCESKPTPCNWWNAFFKFQLIELLAGLEEMSHKLKLWV